MFRVEVDYLSQGQLVHSDLKQLFVLFALSKFVKFAEFVLWE